jgi:HAE1 family hydrophobic/amphiphilic exporter-1
MDMASISLVEALQSLDGKANFSFNQVNVSRDNPEASPIVRLSLFDFKNSKYVEELQYELESIPEISKIELMGLEKPIVNFIIPSGRAAEVGFQGSKALQVLSIPSFADILGNLSLSNNEAQLPVRAEMLTNNMIDIKNLRVGDRKVASIADLAIERGKNPALESVSHSNGHDTIFLEIYAKDGSNLFDLNRHLSSYLEKRDKKDIKYEIIFNKTDDLKAAIADVFEALWQSILITFGIVYIFLRKWRQTIIISLAIPVTLTLTVLLLFVKGISLNVLTLSGLILGLGMVVDNVVLVMGRIDELRRENNSTKTAAAYGAEQVASALLMSTITNACIFLPVAFVEGGDSFTDILKAFQVPILASLLASLFVALLFVPLLSMIWPEKSESSKNERHRGALTASTVLIKFFNLMQQSRIAVSICTVLIVYGLFQWTNNIQQTDLESPRDPYISVNVRFSNEIQAERRREFFTGLEGQFLKSKANLQFQFMVSDFNPAYPTGTLTLYPPDSSDRDEFVAHLEERVKLFLNQQKYPPGMVASVGWVIGPMEKMRTFENFSVVGPKTGVVKTLLNQLRETVRDFTGVDEVLLESETSGSRGMVFIPDESILTKFGINLQKIAAELNSRLASTSLSEINYNGREVGLHIQIQPEVGEYNLNLLKTTPIPVDTEHSIALADLGHFQPFRFKNTLSRREGISTSRLMVYYKEGLSSEDKNKLRVRLNNAYAHLNFPPGYGPPKSDSQARVEDMKNKTLFILLLSIFLIYLILGGMLESFFIPFAILFTVPLALLFGAGGLVLFGMDLDVMARLALVILVGSGVNAAIILIDMINSLREQGMSRREAVVFGCAQRFKAVLMSTSIQVVGVLPIAMGKAKIMGIPYASLGIAIMSGMLFSTLATLVVLPMLYELMDDLQIKVYQLFFNHSGSDSAG